MLESVEERQLLVVARQRIHGRAVISLRTWRAYLINELCAGLPHNIPKIHFNTFNSLRYVWIFSSLLHGVVFWSSQIMVVFRVVILPVNFSRGETYHWSFIIYDLKKWIIYYAKHKSLFRKWHYFKAQRFRGYIKNLSSRSVNNKFCPVSVQFIFRFQTYPNMLIFIFLIVILKIINLS